MRKYFQSNLQSLSNRFVLFFLITAFLVPSVHGHESWQDNLQFHHDLTLSFDSHEHSDDHGGRNHKNDPFSFSADHFDVTKQDHQHNQHSHFVENLHFKTKRCASETGKSQKSIFQRLSYKSNFEKVVKEHLELVLPTALFSNSKYIFNATNLPPPAV